LFAGTTLYGCDGSPALDLHQLSDSGDSSLMASAGGRGADSSVQQNAGGVPELKDAGTSPRSVDAHSEHVTPDAHLDAASDAIPVSRYCGDSIRDPVKEECDDGPGDAEDSCSADCRVHDVPVTATRSMDAGRSPRFGQTLGVGRHPSSGSKRGVGIVYMDDLDHSKVWLQPYDAWGAPNGARLDAAAGGLPTSAANPVVAALPSGRFAVAWVDGLQGTPDIALRSIDVGAPPSGTPSLAHDDSGGIQTDPDILWTGTEVVVAWTDGFDLKSRRFDRNLTPLETEQRLAATPAFESNVALAPSAGGWAAAWRVVDDQGLETIHARSGSTEWTTHAAYPGPEGDHPALVSLDDTHMLLVYSVGVYPTDASIMSVGRLRIAILDSAKPGEVDSTSLAMKTSPYADEPTLAQRRPSAVAVGNRFFVAWEMESPGDVRFLTDAWFQEITWSEAQGISPAHEWRAPRDAARFGHQHNPSLASSPLIPDGALIAVWEDDFGDRSSGADADLVLRFRPVPFVTLADASSAS
jgi:cysteine-rich repeat protein